MQSPIAWRDAVQIAQLLAVNPAGLGGVSLRSGAGPVRDRWLAVFRSLLGDAPVRRVPLHISDERLLGGMDLTATLQRGRPVVCRGVLAEAHGGVLLLTMAERLESSTVSHLTAAIDTGELALERDGLSARAPARFAVVAMDEGLDDEQVPAALLDRLAFLMDLSELHHSEVTDAEGPEAAQSVVGAQSLLHRVQASDDTVCTLCQTAMALGIDSLRTAMLAVQVARASAALAGRLHTELQDAQCAARLVLAPRATAVPPYSADTTQEAPQQDPIEPPARDECPPSTDDRTQPEASGKNKTADEQVLEAAKSAIPAGLLARLQHAALQPHRSGTAGKNGAPLAGGQRGRPKGVKAGQPGPQQRLNLIETLRAAAPWQRLRRTQVAADTLQPRAVRLEVRSQDFRVTRYQQRTSTTTVFVVDASGSAALARLAETKGAVELLLADCYVRRDQVAVLAFRGVGCELLLPPTRSLVRAKRSLAGLPGGGGTPLATALDTATQLVTSIRKKGDTPAIVLLTDGQANINRLGQPNRSEAHRDALASAAGLRATGVPVLLIDTSPRPQPAAQALANAMRAVYLPLPFAGSADLSNAVKTAAEGLSPTR